MSRVNRSLLNYYLENGICDSINGEIIMLQGKELLKAARELARYSIMFPEEYREPKYVVPIEQEYKFLIPKKK